VGNHLARVYDSATICVKTFITYITVIVPTANGLRADVFGTGIFSLTSSAIPATYPAPPVCFFLFPLPHPTSFNFPDRDNLLSSKPQRLPIIPKDLLPSPPYSLITRSNEYGYTYTVISRIYVVVDSDTGDVTRDKFSHTRNVQTGRVVRKIAFDHEKKYIFMVMKSLQKHGKTI
jgi:hypothetical protein